MCKLWIIQDSFPCLMLFVVYSFRSCTWDKSTNVFKALTLNNYPESRTDLSHWRTSIISEIRLRISIDRDSPVGIFRTRQKQHVTMVWYVLTNPNETTGHVTPTSDSNIFKRASRGYSSSAGFVVTRSSRTSPILWRAFHLQLVLSWEIDRSLIKFMSVSNRVLR